MSGGRSTKKIPEKIYFSQSSYNGWVQGPWVNRPKGYKDENLQIFNLVKEGEEKKVKRESWEEFCARFGVTPDDIKKDNMAAFIYLQCVYVYEQKMNWRRQIVQIKKLLEVVAKKRY